MREKILIVEDDTSLSELVALHLDDLGYETERVADGQRGLERALSGAHQLVILDVMLPRLDGLEVCKRLRLEGATANKSNRLFLTGIFWRPTSACAATSNPSGPLSCASISSISSAPPCGSSVTRWRRMVLHVILPLCC